MMNKLKSCPFCGGEVLFEHDFAIYDRTHHGECEQCGMIFEYTEKYEELIVDYPNLGESRIYHNIHRRRNTPFEDLWNRRANDAE